MDLVRDSRALVRHHRARHHAEGYWLRLRLARDSVSCGDGRGAAGGERPLLSRAAGVGMRQILFLAQAEVLHIVRDRVLMAQTLIVPMIQLLVLANAATFEIRNTPIQIVDFDRSSTSRGVVNHLAANGHFDIVDTTPSLDRADQRLLDGSITMAVIVPHEFETSLVKTGIAPVELSVN